jgi:AmmeMemoRadiSam system protein B/AmmeMemoRadiSam system protein A
MIEIRQPAVAGTFYTDDPSLLRNQVEDFLRDAKPAHHTPKALIAPHAGYVYSGPVAGSAYAAVASLRDRVTRVVLLGPAHRVAVSGVAASSARAFASPLGEVPVDQDTVARLVNDLDFLFYMDEAHALEHSLEVHLPFLQIVLDDFVLLPFAVGGADPTQIERLLETLWGGPETLIVISSDLSHYHDYTTAQKLDRYTTGRIEHFDPASLSGEHACGQIPVRGLLRSATRHRLQVETLDTRNSGDTAGPRDQVVGYGAYSFYEARPERSLPEAERGRLTGLAQQSIKHGLDHGGPLPVTLEDWPESLQSLQASFITLKKNGDLRGCIGSLEATRPLVEDVAHNAYAAAFSDPRFSKVDQGEFLELHIHISILSPPEPITFGSQQELIDQLRPGIDGLILTEGNSRGTFLPSVWENIPQRNSFLQQLKRKAGLDPNYWSPTVRVARYTTESW